MSCYICDKPIDEPRLDPRDMKTRPCSTCEAIIQDTLDSYPKAGDDPDDFTVMLEPQFEEFSDLWGYNSIWSFDTEE